MVLTSLPAHRTGHAVTCRAVGTTRTLLITGGAGQLGTVAHATFSRAGWRVVSTDVEQLDVRHREEVLAAVDEVRPDAVLNAAAIADADLCEVDPDLAFATNGTAVGHLAEACRHAGALLCHISSDYVFDGRKRQPYDEGDAANPLSVYGRSKLDGERIVGTEGLVVRTAWLSSSVGQNIVRTVLAQAADPERVLRYVDDQRGCPTSADDLAGALLQLVEERWTGVFHVTNQGEATWFDLARHVLAEGGQDPDRVRPIRTEDLDPPRLAPRPAYSVLDNSALRMAGAPLLRHWTDATAEIVEQVRRSSVP
jgi:dTDP-4-dehydrorhamnose reductase